MKRSLDDYLPKDKFMELLNTFNLQYAKLPEQQMGQLIAHERKVLIDPKYNQDLHTVVYELLWFFYEYQHPIFSNIEWEKWFDIAKISSEYISSNPWLQDLDLQNMITNENQ